MPIANVWKGYWTWASFSCFKRVAATKLESKPPMSKTTGVLVMCRAQTGTDNLYSDQAPRLEFYHLKSPTFIN